MRFAVPNNFCTHSSLIEISNLPISQKKNQTWLCINCKFKVIPSIINSFRVKIKYCAKNESESTTRVKMNMARQYSSKLKEPSVFIFANVGGSH